MGQITINHSPDIPHSSISTPPYLCESALKASSGLLPPAGADDTSQQITNLFLSNLLYTQLHTYKSFNVLQLCRALLPYESHPTQALPAHTFTHPLQLHAETDQNFYHISTLLSKTAMRMSLESFFKQRRRLLFLPHCGPSSQGLQFSCMAQAKMLQYLGHIYLEHQEAQKVTAKPFQHFSRTTRPLSFLQILF
jgi:hypothetical protein